MSAKRIKLNEVFASSSAITRQAAREIFDMISRLPEQEVVLDFENVNFASRSFFDELLSKQDQLNLLGKKIEFSHMKEDLKMLQNIVIETKQSRSSITYPSVANVDTVTI